MAKNNISIFQRQECQRLKITINRQHNPNLWESPFINQIIIQVSTKPNFQTRKTNVNQQKHLKSLTVGYWKAMTLMMGHKITNVLNKFKILILLSNLPDKKKARTTQNKTCRLLKEYRLALRTSKTSKIYALQAKVIINLTI